MTTPLLSDNIRKAKDRYRVISHEIDEGRNLQEVLKELDESIMQADDLIVAAILKDSPHSGIDALKDELWYLKFQILERAS